MQYSAEWEIYLLRFDKPKIFIYVFGNHEIMIWKDWTKGQKYGGIIGAVIFLLIFIFDFSYLCGFGFNFGEYCGSYMMIASAPWVMLFMWLQAGKIWYFGVGLISLIIYFFLGVLIGFMIDKIKSKK